MKLFKTLIIAFLYAESKNSSPGTDQPLVADCQTDRVRCKPGIAGCELEKTRCSPKTPECRPKEVWCRSKNNVPTVVSKAGTAVGTGVVATNRSDILLKVTDYISFLLDLKDVYDFFSKFKPKTILKAVSKNDCRVEETVEGKTCYHITVKTSDIRYAGTNKKIELKLWHLNPDDSVNKVMENIEVSEYLNLDNWGDDLERNAIDEYYFAGNDLGPITAVSIRHSGWNDHWMPDHIFVNSKLFKLNGLVLDNNEFFIPSNDDFDEFINSVHAKSQS